MKKFLPIFLSIILTALIVGAGSYYWGKWHTASDKNSVSDTLTFGSRYNYSISYPASWVLYRYPSPEEGAQATLKMEEADKPISEFSEVLYIMPEKSGFCEASEDHCAPGEFSDAFELKVAPNTKNYTLDDLYKADTETWRSDPESGFKSLETTIGDQKAMKWWLDCGINQGLGCDQPTWITLCKDKIYYVNYNLTDITTDFDKIVEGIKFNENR